MTHPTEQLVLYASGELPDDEARAIARHLAGCADCARAVAEMSAVDARLRALSWTPPASLPGRQLWRFALVAAASLCIGVAAGLWARAITDDRPASADDRPQFMLTLYEPVSERLALDDRSRRDRGRRMVDWVTSLRASGVFVSGEKLRDEAGRIVSAAGVDDHVGRVPGGELISGYFIIAATDYDEATRIARASPIVAVGGRVSVRAVQ